MILDFLTHGGIVSDKNGPLAKFVSIECLTFSLYHGTIVAPGTGGTPWEHTYKQLKARGLKI